MSVVQVLRESSALEKETTSLLMLLTKIRIFLYFNWKLLRRTEKNIGAHLKVTVGGCSRETGLKVSSVFSERWFCFLSAKEKGKVCFLYICMHTHIYMVHLGFFFPTRSANILDAKKFLIVGKGLCEVIWETSDQTAKLQGRNWSQLNV